MKTRIKTIKGWANNSSYLFSQNSNNLNFEFNLKKFIESELTDFKELRTWDDLRGKNAKEKVIIKGYYWRGSWSDPTKETVKIFYK
jgi:hypothetical protein